MLSDVIEISQMHYYDGKDGEFSGGYSHSYYANEIGLIWEQDFASGLRERYLEDYYIAQH